MLADIFQFRTDGHLRKSQIVLDPARLLHDNSVDNNVEIWDKLQFFGLLSTKDIPRKIKI